MTFQELSDKISNLRYAPLKDYPKGGYLFEINGQTIYFGDSNEVPLLENNDSGRLWVANRYWFLLSVLC